MLKRDYASFFAGLILFIVGAIASTSLNRGAVCLIARFIIMPAQYHQ
jgi:hypothetical protein